MDNIEELYKQYVELGKKLYEAVNPTQDEINTVIEEANDCGGG